MVHRRHAVGMLPASCTTPPPALFASRATTTLFHAFINGGARDTGRFADDPPNPETPDNAYSVCGGMRAAAIVSNWSGLA